MKNIPEESRVLTLYVKLLNTNISDNEGIKVSAWKVSKYGFISGPYFPVFNPNTGKYGPEMTPYLDTFHAVSAYAESH